MLDASTATELHNLSTAIRVHPRFGEVRRAYIKAGLKLYENEPAVNKLMLEAGRMLLFGVALCLAAAHDDADRASWATVTRLQATLAAFGVASPRQIDLIVARLVQSGFLRVAPAPADRRIRLVMPTQALLDHDLDWLEANFLPLHRMFPEPGYPLPMRRDQDFQRAQRIAALSILPWAGRIMSANPPMLPFLRRYAGALVLMKLIQASDDASPGGINFTDLGARFAVSRTHIRALLEEAEQLHLVELTGRGRRRVRLLPPLLAAYDQFTADSMAAHELTHRMALSALAGLG
jgi:hypothetical protein